MSDFVVLQLDGSPLGLDFGLCLDLGVSGPISCSFSVSILVLFRVLFCLSGRLWCSHVVLRLALFVYWMQVIVGFLVFGVLSGFWTDFGAFFVSFFTPFLGWFYGSFSTCGLFFCALFHDPLWGCFFLVVFGVSVI